MMASMQPDSETFWNSGEDLRASGRGASGREKRVRVRYELDITGCRKTGSNVERGENMTGGSCTPQPVERQVAPCPPTRQPKIGTDRGCQSGKQTATQAAQSELYPRTNGKQGE